MVSSEILGSKVVFNIDYLFVYWFKTVEHHIGIL